MFDINNLNHYGKLESLSTLFNVLFPILSILAVVGVLFLLKFGSKSELSKKITKISMAAFIVVLYLTKTIFWIIRATGVYASETGFNMSYFVNTFGLDVNFYIMLITVFVLLYSAFSKKQGRFLNFLKQTMLGIGLPLAIISLINPRLVVDIRDNWYHCVNLAPIIINAMFILCPLYLVLIGEVKFDLTKFWKAVCGYICIACLCMTLALVINKNISSFLTLQNSLLIIKLQVAYPWYLLIVIPVFLLISFGIYTLGWYLSKKLCNKNAEQTEVPASKAKNEFFELYAFATKSIACLQGFLILILLAIIVRSPYTGTFLGLLCILPFVMTIFCLLTVFEMDRLAEVNDETIFEQNNPMAKRFLTYSFIGNVIFGYIILRQYRNERSAIEDRKRREKKRKEREQLRLEAEQKAAKRASAKKSTTAKKTSTTKKTSAKKTETKKTTTTRKKKVEETEE